MTLKMLRTSAGYTQKEFAKKLGVSVNSVVSWEGGVRFPRQNQMEAMSKLLDVKETDVYMAAKAHSKTA